MKEVNKMTDTKLRELERKWNQSGLPEDGNSYVRECLRSVDLGELRQELYGILYEQNPVRSGELMMELGSFPSNIARGSSFF